MFSSRTLTDRMSLRERLRAAWIIIRSPYFERVDVVWTRPDGKRASRIWLGVK